METGQMRRLLCLHLVHMVKDSFCHGSAQGLLPAGSSKSQLSDKIDRFVSHFVKLTEYFFENSCNLYGNRFSTTLLFHVALTGYGSCFLTIT